jgi:hypothetical protein
MRDERLRAPFTLERYSNGSYERHYTLPVFAILKVLKGVEVKVTAMLGGRVVSKQGEGFASVTHTACAYGIMY